MRAAREKDFLIKDFNEKWRSGNESKLAAAWDSDLRVEVIDDDGVAAEVLVPRWHHRAKRASIWCGSQPQALGGRAGAPMGRRACPQSLDRGVLSDVPLRRIGLAVVPMLYDVEHAVKEVVWAHDNGLKGILIPALMGDHDPYNHPKYHPVWQACEERGMVVHNHSGPSPDYNFELPGAMGVFLVEFAWWAARPLWHLIFGGVFEKFPSSSTASPR